MDLGDVVHTQAGLRHGLAHGDAVGIGLLQPGRVELTDERARAQEGGPIALAFFFGKRHHLDAHWQPAAGLVQLLHTGHGHEDAQTPVVLAAVTDGVIVTARQQVAATRIGRVVASDDIAHGVDLDFVEAAVVHPVADALGAGAVRLGQVGDGQLAFFGKAGVAVGAELFLPVPDLLAFSGLDAEFVVQPNFDDAMNMTQALLELKVRVSMKAALEGFDDLRLVQTHAARAAHGQNERPAELLLVVGVELLDLGKFFRGAFGQARFGLLVGGLGRQGFADHGLARQFRVGADQVQLCLATGLGEHDGHGVFEVGQRSEGPLPQCLLGDPGRMLVQAVQHPGGFVRRGLIELG